MTYSKGYLTKSDLNSLHILIPDFDVYLGQIKMSKFCIFKFLIKRAVIHIPTCLVKRRWVFCMPGKLCNSLWQHQHGLPDNAKTTDRRNEDKPSKEYGRYLEADHLVQCFVIRVFFFSPKLRGKLAKGVRLKKCLRLI